MSQCGIGPQHVADVLWSELTQLVVGLATEGCHKLSIWCMLQPTDTCDLSRQHPSCYKIKGAISLPATQIQSGSVNFTDAKSSIVSACGKETRYTDRKSANLANAQIRLARFCGLKPASLSVACLERMSSRCWLGLYPKVPNAHRILAMCCGLH